MSRSDESMLSLDLMKLSKDVDDVVMELDRAHTIMLKAMISEMVEFGYGVMGIAMRTAPKLTGTLRGSATTTVQSAKVAHTEHQPGTKVGAKAIRDFKAGKIGVNKFVHDYVGEIVFNTIYATVQHEAVDYHHTDGEAKYLEKPLKKQSPELSKNIAKIVKKALNRAKKIGG